MSSPGPERGKLGTNTTGAHPSKKAVVLLSYIFCHFWDMFKKWNHLSSDCTRERPIHNECHVGHTNRSSVEWEFDKFLDTFTQEVLQGLIVSIRYNASLAMYCCILLQFIADYCSYFALWTENGRARRQRKCRLQRRQMSKRPVDWQVDNFRDEGIVYMKPLTHVTMKCSSLGCLASNSIDVGFDLFLAAPYKVCTCKHGTDTSVTPTAAGVWFFKFFWAALLGTATKEKDGVPSIKRKFSSDCMQERSIQRGCHFLPKSTTTVLHKGFTSISGERAVDFEMFQFAAPHQHRHMSYEFIKLELHALGTGITPQVLKTRGSSGPRFCMWEHVQQNHARILPSPLDRLHAEEISSKRMECLTCCSTSPNSAQPVW